MPDLAIVGAGIMGASHGRVARTLPGVRLAAVCDTDHERAKALAHGTDAVITADLDEALEAADAVILATPSHTHGALGEHILKSGRDLLVEKPIATEIADAERLIDAAAENDRILMVGHVERFNPAVVELRRLVTEPLALEITRVGPFYARNLADVVLDLMIHDIDLARAIVGGEIVEQHAMGRPVLTEEPDFANALLGFDNGVLANITASRVSQSKIRRITLTQRDNVVVADLLRQQIEVHRIEHSEFLTDGGVRYRQSGLVEIPYLAEHGEPLMHELRHFVECVRERRQPSVSGADGLASLRVCLQIVAGIRDSAGVR
jgi:UDP-N-acetylglucosamine 3-dehydrogenase